MVNSIHAIKRTPCNTGHFLWDQFSHIFSAGGCYSGHNFLALHQKFKPNLPLYSGHLIFYVRKRNSTVIQFSNLFDTILYFYIYSDLSNLSKAFLSQVITLESLYKIKSIIREYETENPEVTRLERLSKIILH